MGRFLAFTSLLLLIALPSTSQPLRQWGLKLGSSISSSTWEVSSVPDYSLRSRFGLDAAVYAEWPNVPVFSIVSELHYVQRGFRADDPLISRGHLSNTLVLKHYDYDLRLDYLSIAFLPKVRLERGLVDVYALAGPQVDVALSHTAIVDGQGPMGGFFTSEMDHLAGNFRKTLVGLTLGLGVELRSLLPVTTGLEVRFRPNLQDTYATDPYVISSNSFEFLITLGM